MKIVLNLLLILLAFSCKGQSLNIYGVLVDMNTQDPIDGVKVWEKGRLDAAILTRNRGYFRFKKEEKIIIPYSNEIELVFEKEGYLPFSGNFWKCPRVQLE